MALGMAWLVGSTRLCDRLNISMVSWACRLQVVHVAGVLEGPEGSLREEDRTKIGAALDSVRLDGWANLTGV